MDYHYYDIKNITAANEENIKMFCSQYGKICRLFTTILPFYLFIHLYVSCSLNF